MYSYTMTPLDLYKLPDLDKRAISGAVSVYIYPASGQRAVQLVQSVSEARWTLTVGHTGAVRRDDRTAINRMGVRTANSRTFLVY